MYPLKNLIKHIVYSLRDLRLPKYEPHIKEKSLLILRLDAIGDFILFRNFIEVIKKSEKYKDHSITIIGNELWKTIAENLDSDWVDRFIWINTKSFHKNFSYRKSVLSEVEDTFYSVLFHPTYSRDYYISETIAKRVHSDIKTAPKGDRINIEKWQKEKADKIYDTLIEIDPALYFEFEQNKAIVKAFIQEESQLVSSLINTDKLPVFLKSPGHYIVLFIGGNATFRKWSHTNWIALIHLLLDDFHEDLIIAGGPNDKEFATLIYQHFDQNNSRLKNLCGETDLMELISLIKGSNGMISNETSAVHMAVALNIPVIVISNANHYGRFSPYPETITTKYEALYPPEMESDEKIRIKNYGPGSSLNINTISPIAVLNQSKKLFKN